MNIRDHVSILICENSFIWSVFSIGAVVGVVQLSCFSLCLFVQLSHGNLGRNFIYVMWIKLKLFCVSLKLNIYFSPPPCLCINNQKIANNNGITYVEKRVFVVEVVRERIKIERSPHDIANVKQSARKAEPSFK